MPKYLDIDGLRTLWAQITNKISHESNATAEALEGKADLVEGKIPASQLPSYVDDVLEYANKASFPATGESGKIYLDLATNLTYRWSGTAYTEISPSLALGTTSSTAYRGDYGAAAYKHAVTNKGIAKASGLYKITTNAEGHVTAATAVVKADITGLGIPAQDTTYENATTTTNGLMSATDKTKLNSIDLSALVKSVNGITPDSNGNIAIEVGGGTVSGDYLPITGGTLTGGLDFGNTNNAIGWTYSNGQGWYVRPYVDTNNFQILKKNAEGNFLGYFSISAEGKVSLYNPLSIDQGGTGATTPEAARTALGITPANIGALALSGGTLTDTLYCQSTAGMIGLAIGTASKPENVSIISVGDGTEFNRFSFRQYGTNGNRENFNLPNTTTPAQNVNYSILTSKNPVTIPQGGTGATDATTACENLGALSLSGGTLTGNLVLNKNLELKNGADDALIYFTPTNSSAAGGIIIYNKPTSGNTDNSRIFFRQYSYSSSDLNTRTSYYENYYLPKTVRGLTANGSYEIITSKGGTMTGSLMVGELIVKRSNNYPTVRFYDSNSNEAGSIQFNASTHKGYIVQKATDTTYQEIYNLPTVSTGLTANKNYDILTSKGGTTTGKLYLANGSGVHGTDTGWTSIGFYGTSNKLRGSLMLSDGHRFHFNQQETGASYAERYLLPTVATGLTGDVWYSILTSKNAVTIAQGGTGATTAAAARTALDITPANIGALPSSGGTLTGNLTISNSNNYSYLYLANQNGENIGGLYASDSENRLYLINHAPNSTAGKYEGYGLPAVTTDNLTDNKWYTILTSKNAVTVAQGGTGRTTLTSGYALVGNGTSAVALRAITNNTAKGPLEWTSSTGTNLVTSNTLAYWNGAYTGTSSNITVLGTITKGVWNGSAIPITHGGTNATTATGARENLLIKVSATAPSSPTTGTIWVDIS